MSIELSYHAVGCVAGSLSYFDDVLMRIIAGQKICIACPYLHLSYL